MTDLGGGRLAEQGSYSRRDVPVMACLPLRFIEMPRS